jgi:hypothetical protein
MLQTRRITSWAIFTVKSNGRQNGGLDIKDRCFRCRKLGCMAKHCPSSEGKDDDSHRGHKRGRKSSKVYTALRINDLSPACLHRKNER